jgi:hypothetical protein
MDHWRCYVAAVPALDALAAPSRHAVALNTMTMVDPYYLTTADVCRLVSPEKPITRRTLLRWIDAGHIAAGRPSPNSRRLRWCQADIDDYYARLGEPKPAATVS